MLRCGSTEFSHVVFTAVLLYIQEWQIRMYGGSGPRGTQRGGEGSPDTEETDISGDDTSQRKGSGPPIGAINPLLIRGQGVGRCSIHSFSNTYNCNTAPLKIPQLRCIHV